MAEKSQGAAQQIADKDIEIVHDLRETPSIYIDGVQGFSFVNGMVKINCFQIVQQFGASQEEVTIKKVFNVQLVMPPTVGKNLATWLMQNVTAAEEELAQTPVKSAE